MNDQNFAPSLDRFFNAPLGEIDPEIAGILGQELVREQDGIELIASENMVSAAVMAAQGSVLTNKYAEGYPGKRYYGGCGPADLAETLAIERVKKLFDAGFANVQANSGSQANQSVFLALLNAGDTILGMSLAAGGHLTHGATPNMSGKWFNAVQYGVRKDDGLLDYDELAALAHSTSRNSSSRAARPIRASSIFRESARSRIRSARSSWSTWRISPAWSQPACTRRRCRTRMSSPPPRIKPCAARAAAWC